MEASRVGRVRGGRALRRKPGRTALVSVATIGLVGLTAVGASGASSPSTVGVLSAVAGGPGSGRALNVSQSPAGLAVARDGTVSIADTEGYLRTITPGSNQESVIAGAGPYGSTTQGAPASEAALSSSSIFGSNALGGEAMDAAGDQIVAAPSLDAVRLLAATSGTRFGIAMRAGHVYTILGTPATAGTSPTGTAASAALLSAPEGVAVDPAGDLVVADTGNNEVKVLAATTGRHFGMDMSAGKVYIVAGTGTSGSTGTGGAATSAELKAPAAVAVGPAGSLVIADTGNNRVVVVAARHTSLFGAVRTRGDLYVVTGTGTAATSGDGGPAAAAAVDLPVGVTVDRSGDLIVSSTGEVRVVSSVTHTVFGVAMAAGDIYALLGNGTAGGSPAGTKASASRVFEPAATAFDKAGNLLVADAGAGRVYLLAKSTGADYRRSIVADHVYVVAGDSLYLSSGYDAPAVQAEDNTPVFLSASKAGIAIADLGELGLGFFGGSPITGAFAASRVRVVAQQSGSYFGIHMIKGNIYTVAGGGRTNGLILLGAPRSGAVRPGALSATAAQRRALGQAAVAGSGEWATNQALLGPVEAVYDRYGNLVVTEDFGDLIDVVAGKSGTYYGRSMIAGHIYLVAGSPTGQVANGIPATQARLTAPTGMVLDPAGNIIFVEEGSATANGTSTGDDVRVVAARTGTYYGQSMVAGDIYAVAGNGTDADTGDGGPAASAELAGPFGLAVDGSGDLAVSTLSTSTPSVRMIAATTGTHLGVPMVAGDIYTVAGGSAATLTGSGGPALATKVYGAGLAFTADGSMVVTDGLNNGPGAAGVDMVANSAATRFGVAMVTGNIYRIAGNGQTGQTVTGAEALRSPTGLVYGVATDPSGNLLFSDFFSGETYRISAT